MVKWEYLMLMNSRGTDQRTASHFDIYVRQGAVEAQAEQIQIVLPKSKMKIEKDGLITVEGCVVREFLDMLGDTGWELVAITGGGGVEVRDWAFKRPREGQ